MKSAPSIDYVDVSSGRPAGEAVDDDALREPADVTTIREHSTGPEASEAPEDAEAVDPPENVDTSILVSADVHAVMLGLWASGLRCVIVYALAPAIGSLGPLAVGAALVIQVTGGAVCISGAHSLWRRRHHGRRVYALICVLICLCTLAALLAPAGF